MSKFDQVVEKAKEQLKKLGVSNIDEELLRKIARGLGPSIYKADASLVSCTDADEVERIKQSNFTKKNFNLSDAELTKLIESTCEKMKPLKGHKMRVVFYYLMMTS